MIYWLKRLEWKIRKALGLYKKRIKTIDDIVSMDYDFLMKIICIIMIIFLARTIISVVFDLYLWFFPLEEIIVRQPWIYPI